MKEISNHGAGLGYRQELSENLASREHGIDVVEILADQWMSPGSLGQLREISERFDTVTHGVAMSLAGAGRIDTKYLERVREVVEVCQSDYYSEHLAATHIPGIDSQHLCPPIVSAESRRACVRNVKQANSALGVPLAIENITYSISTTSDHLEAAKFFADVVVDSDSLILLDVANLYINSQNHRFDPEVYLSQLPLERVVHIHLAGGVTTSTGKLIDSHSESIAEGIWDLARNTAELCNPRTVIVERDQNFPDADVLLEEVATARSIYFDHQ
ncbi:MULTISPECIES: DUF692 family multinuclear iron-containing protein [unclassified Streptomyces]|uniref:DUF692 domain-containing protein n=1 Tax=unclassified Streptomyces TaxID=2593676 RepID=UPI0013DE422C|nr:MULTISPECIES: DUF692 domain-containing protein [unclassified Streptomyces]MCX4394178.1 DUF692 domain-containing protein [Streptomyces sp. NBC_01767]WSC27908.1 DUF692 domain-containing protein [Streptomyces sp. NBC_01768]WSX03790.1 DUF692 domain-containing protein [Streptomyces sp. NBC_00987]